METPPAGDAPLRVRLLGRFEIIGVDERTLGTTKARSVLRRLAAARGDPVPVDELVGVAWGDDLPRKPRDQLSVLISRLRGVLGPDRIRRGDAGYWLSADWTDVAEVERRVREGRERLAAGQAHAAVAAAQAATAMARGQLLPEEASAWIEEPRAAADRLAREAWLLAAEASLAVGDATTARLAAVTGLDHDPYDEAALRALMRAEALAGRPAEALLAFERTRALLAEELGVDPGAETRALHTAVLQGRAGEPAATRATADVPFVGRRDERRRLDGALARARRGETVAVVVEGEAGMGKTALLRAWTAGSCAGAVVVAGRCDEMGRNLPLQPVVDGLSAHLRSAGRDRARDVLGDAAEMLGPLLGHAPASQGTGITTVDDVSASRLRLFSALTVVLTRAAGDEALVLVIDDLHAAEPATGEFLAFALRRLPRALLLAARRPERGVDLVDAERLTLGPLELADSVALAGPDRGGAMHERSGGNPLFLVELVRAPGSELPGSIVAAVSARLEHLGAAAATLRAAAVLGPAIDVDMLAAATGSPVDAILDDLEQGAAARVLEPRGAGLAFAHEIVREAVEGSMSPARRTAIHRAAARSLSARGAVDPLVVSYHARLGDDPVLAASALIDAAAGASGRWDPRAAEGYADQAIALHDTSEARLTRGRLRLGRLDLEGAKGDALRAIDLGAGAEGFEAAGWIEYYARDYDAARRYADEGAARSREDAVRASCLALGGRVRHTRGELAEAAVRLEEAVSVAPASVRGVAQCWQAHLLAHRGDVDAAVDVARSALLDPHVAHPFAPLHARFALAFSLGLAGRWDEALVALDDLDAAVARSEDRRFPPVAANVRGWLLRAGGLVDEAMELHSWAAGVALGPSFLEPSYAARLDLCEDRLAAGDVPGAGEVLSTCDGIIDWVGSMSWRHRQRYRLLRARVALEQGLHDRAREQAAEVADSAAGVLDRRYECRGRLLESGAAARAGDRVDEDGLHALVERFRPLAGVDGWRDLASVAQETGWDWCRTEAEDLALRVAAAARRSPGVDAGRVAVALRRSLDGSRAAAQRTRKGRG